MKIGILDIQGSVEEHFEALARLKVATVLVKKVEDFKEIPGLIIPGGESMTIGKLLDWYGLKREIVKRAKKGLAIWGTCAGAILMAKKVEGKDRANTLGLMNVAIARNAYGRQLESFEAEVKFLGKNFPGIFIRAPKIIEIREDVEVLGTYKKDVIAVKEGNFLATTFHPELTTNLAVHKYFVEMCRK
jgi:5'-phosphate synthase pdxT subunit